MRLYELDARPQAAEAGQVHRAAFVAVGHVDGLRHLVGGRAGAALAQRAKRADCVQSACALRPEQPLVPRKGVQIALEVAHVDRQVSDRLRPVHQAEHALPLHRPADRRRGLQRAGHVRGLRYDGQAGVPLQRPLELLGLHKMAARLEQRDLDLPGAAQLLQHTQHRIVLKERAHHVVAPAETRP